MLKRYAAKGQCQDLIKDDQDQDMSKQSSLQQEYYGDVANLSPQKQNLMLSCRHGVCL